MTAILSLVAFCFVARRLAVVRAIENHLQKEIIPYSMQAMSPKKKLLKKTAAKVLKKIGKSSKPLKIVKSLPKVKKIKVIKKVKSTPKSAFSAKPVFAMPIKKIAPVVTKVSIIKSEVSSKILAASTKLKALPAANQNHSQPKYRFVKDLLGWGMMIVFGFGVLSVLSDYNSSNPTGTTLTLKKMSQASVATSSESADSPTVLAVGDISLARYIEGKMRAANNYTLPFVNVADFLKQADVTVGMFNNPIVSGKTTAADSFILRTDPRSVEGLTFAGFDLLSLANNQVMNYQDSGLFQTLSALHKAQIQTVGAGKDMDQAHTPAVFNVKGKKIAFYSYVDKNISPNRDDGARANTAGLALMDLKAVADDVKNALKADGSINANFVVVMMHAGVEYKKEPTQFQKDFAHSAVDAGASAVIGTHPHVVQPMESYKNGVIFYSLGNFVFDQYFSDEVRTGLTVTLRFTGEKGTVPEVELNPVRSDSFQPWIPEGAQKEEFLKKVGF